MVIRNPTLRVGVCHIMRQFFIRQMAGVIIIKVITFFLLGGSCSSWRARYPWTWSRGCTPINSQWRHRVSSCPYWVFHPSSSETTQMVLYCHTAQLVQVSTLMKRHQSPLTCVVNGTNTSAMAVICVLVHSKSFTNIIIQSDTSAVNNIYFAPRYTHN